MATIKLNVTGSWEKATYDEVVSCIGCKDSIYTECWKMQLTIVNTKVLVSRPLCNSCFNIMFGENGNADDRLS